MRSNSQILNVCLMKPLTYPFNSIGIRGFFIEHQHNEGTLTSFSG